MRPPRLGGNTCVGVWATRSPYRPNPIGLSCVELLRIEDRELVVQGADLMDGVVIPETLPLDSRQRTLLEDALALDPRPAYQDQAGKVYGMPFEGGELRFKVENNLLTVLSYTL